MSPEAWLFAGTCVTAGCGGLVTIVVQVNKTRSENRRDHARVRSSLDRLDGTVSGLASDVRDAKEAVGKVDEKLDRHIDWHLEHHDAKADR